MAKKKKKNNSAGVSTKADQIFNTAQKQHQANRFEEAEASYLKVLSMQPQRAGALQMLGVLYHEKKETELAIEYMRKALEVNPEHVMANFNLAVMLQERGDFSESEILYRKLLGLKPDFSAAFMNLAHVLKKQYKLEEAEKIFHDIAAREPQNAMALYNLGDIMFRRGDEEESRKYLESALRYEPFMVDAYFRLAQFEGSGDDRAKAEALEKIKRDSGINDEDFVKASYALGQIYENRKEYEKSFLNYSEANKRQATISEKFSIEEYSAYMNTLISIFDRNFFEARKEFGFASDLPVFIVGMPRSGTSLIEQMLASHPGFHGAGELETLNEIYRKIMENSRGLPLETIAAKLDPADCMDYGREYVSYIQELVSQDPEKYGIQRVCDKMPGNFKHIWLIALLLPAARIIHCVRDPADTCLSCFFQHFDNLHPYKNDLRTLGAYYNIYSQVMEHWKKVLPGRILDVRYEDIVGEPEKNIRAMLDFCGMPWDGSCLEFYKNSRPVKTASNLQVRKPLYKNSIRKWMRYEPFISELLDSLNS